MGRALCSLQFPVSHLQDLGNWQDHTVYYRERDFSLVVPPIKHPKNSFRGSGPHGTHYK